MQSSFFHNKKNRVYKYHINHNNNLTNLTVIEFENGRSNST